MPADQHSHLWISPDRVRVERIVPHGGGDTYLRDDVADHSKRLLVAFERSLDAFRAKQDADLALDLIVEITTAQDRPIARERQHLRSLGFELVALSPQAANVAVARIAGERIPKLAGALERYAAPPRHIGKGTLAAIESITPVDYRQKLQVPTGDGEDAAVPCLISLYAGLPADLKEQVAARVSTSLREQGKRAVQVHRYLNGAVGIAADLTRAEMARISEQYMFVRSIESNAQVVSEGAVDAEPIPLLIQIESPRCAMPVAIIDSGVNDNCSLLAGLVRTRISVLPEGSVGPHLSHGTFVASRVVYGDEIATIGGKRAIPWCPVIDVQVTGDDGIGNRIFPTPAQLADVIQAVIPDLARETKVFNLSLGVSPIRDGLYSSLARLLDYLAREHQVLFVISAGNVDAAGIAPPSHYVSEDARILFPSEALLGLTVGAISLYTEPTAIARVRELAPFSRRGPGADRALKPELAAHGGNVLFDGRSWRTSPRIAAYGLNRAGTHLAYTFGTSLAAPIVSQHAARVFDAYPDATPNLVRALLCHFADPVLTPNPGEPIKSHDLCGFGEPRIERALFSAKAAATYLFQGEIQRDTYVYLPFHVPSALVNATGAKLVVRGTVVFDPPVSLDDSVDYALCRIAGQLRKRTSDGMRAIALGGDEDDAVYPWNPIMHFRHSFRRAFASGEWELRLRLMVRGDLPSDFRQSFSVVLEVRDDSDGVPVRTAVTDEFPGIYLPVELRRAA